MKRKPWTRAPAPAREKAAVSARNEDLEREIERDPNLPGPYLVYGDWLQQKGDPRGELIAIQAALLTARGREFARLKLEERILMTRHAAEFLGVLSRAKSTQIEWFCGFVRGIRRPSDDPRFLAHPSARMLQDVSGPRMARPTATLARFAPLTMRVQPHLHDLSWIWDSPRLEAVRVDDARLGTATHAGLKRLRLDRPTNDTLRALAKSTFGSLQTLRLARISAKESPDLVAAVEGANPRELEVAISANASEAEMESLRPVAARVSELSLRGIEGDSLDGVTFPNACVLAVEDPFWRDKRFPALSLPAIRSVHLDGTVELAVSFQASDLAQRIESLHLNHGWGGQVETLAVRRFEKVRELAMSSLPRYESGLSALLRPEVFPALETLGTLNAEHLDLVLESPLAAQLRRLTVQLHDDGGGQVLLKMATRLRALETVVITGSRNFSRETMLALFSLGLDLRWPAIDWPDPV